MDYPGVRYEPRRNGKQFRAYDGDGDARGPWVATEREALGWLRRTTGDQPVIWDDTTRMMLTLLRNHLAKEPDRDAYPEDDGRAQAAYWAAYDEWQAVGFGLRMMVGARLISLALASNLDLDRS